MKEHGLIFSAPMVRALLAGQKSVTRRLSKRLLRIRRGDRIWVREGWRTWKSLDSMGPARIAEKCLDAGYPQPWLDAEFRADGFVKNRSPSGEEFGRWRSALHLPRFGARIIREVTEDARLERLQDITEEEAQAEGVEPMMLTELRKDRLGFEDVPNYVAGFAALWIELHGADSWAANPEVVVLRFKETP